jgi:type VI protein secretion system component Hcp
MAEGDATDLIMKFVLNGSPIAGESTTKLVQAGGLSNPLLAGFKLNRMFEIDSFALKSGVVDDSDSQQTADSIAAPGGFQAWRAGKSHQYPVDLQPVSFIRSIDMSSTQLIQSCIDRVVFDSATLIKRKAAGGPAAGEVFLRIDFHGVLVVGVQWSDDTEVKETCQFICRGTTISYRPQLPDGSLGGTIARFWSMVPGMTQPPYS